jgi:PAS domain S-box-containing protein
MSDPVNLFLNPERLLSAIVDSSDDAIISKDLNGIITSWNGGAERIFGYTAEEMIGQPILWLIPENRREEEPMILSRLRNGERVNHFDTKRMRKDGKLIDVSLSVSPIRDDEGVIVGASKIARDITMQREAAAVLAAAAEETERQSRMKDEFLATLSHELRTPLQSILGWLQILRAGDLEPGELEEGLEIIDRNAHAQRTIIEELLDMNRIVSGKVRLEIQRVDLAAIIEASIETVRPAAQAKNIQLGAVLASIAKPVMADPQRLQQVFWNLLSNAVKFTPPNGKVDVILQKGDSNLDVTITDTGMGIDEKFLPLVFDRFRQADASSTRAHGGLGLGLAIVKNLVELHGGEVSARSEGIGQGSTFCVTLPHIANSLPENYGVKSTSARRDTPSPPELRGVSVVVVDDDLDSCNLVARILSKAGARVRLAGSADEGLRLIAEQVPSVVVSDIGMPGKSGYAFIEQLRSLSAQEGGRVPAVALTAYSRMEDRIKALNSGFQIHLPKPVDAFELVVIVANLAKHSNALT